jgi:hypothetical protein
VDSGWQVTHVIVADRRFDSLTTVSDMGIYHQQQSITASSRHVELSWQAGLQ